MCPRGLHLCKVPSWLRYCATDARVAKESRAHYFSLLSKTIKQYLYQKQPFSKPQLVISDLPTKQFLFFEFKFI